MLVVGTLFYTLQLQRSLALRLIHDSLSDHLIAFWVPWYWGRRQCQIVGDTRDEPHGLQKREGGTLLQGIGHVT
jgi:hypothetical protein